MALRKRHSLQACFSISENRTRSVVLSLEPASESPEAGLTENGPQGLVPKCLMQWGYTELWGPVGINTEILLKGAPPSGHPASAGRGRCWRRAPGLAERGPRQRKGRPGGGRTCLTTESPASPPLPAPPPGALVWNMTFRTLWHSRSGLVSGLSQSAHGQPRPGDCSGRVDVFARPAPSGSSFIPEGSVFSASWVAPLQGSQSSREVGATALPPASLGLAGLCSDNTAVAGPLQLSRAQFPCWLHYGIGPHVDNHELTPEIPPGRSPRLQWPNSSCVKNQLKESFLLSQTFQEFLVTGRGVTRVFNLLQCCQAQCASQRSAFHKGFSCFQPPLHCFPQDCDLLEGWSTTASQ
nr:uncharacterized protein LOC129460265 [Symphalangus syndactylus]